ncbi:uncharacterized protein LOC134185865 isoform X1 [Corticium candelabrum]|uniref:uncharacterized protein LOC134185865 isoform X1 n=1 Tax=Corticium candelabrum TaxID=121492 RepID=UPI002E25ABBD|nr:uncharacterized protein LOC134185865 isoform X1 [Corticium candelabrum]XP_062509732.1 uncharacterized protein LOC134185865 isoform X1 [Corticium candelabrum]XP_062509733.1 uncharacterized protein LOC134185865 isoform X1 [Corticium candelabrum]
MEFSLYVFLFTLFIAHDKLSTSSSPSRNTRNEVQQLPLDNILPATFASKDTKTSAVFNSNCQSFNKFGRFSSWTCNTPLLTNSAFAKLVIKPSMRIQEYRYRILVFGEMSTTETGDTILDEATSYQTWIYYEETDSWKMIASVAHGLPSNTWLRLVTICSSHAIILSPDAINSTWIFVFEQLIWKRVAIVGDGPSWTDIRYDIYAVSVESEHSLCSCSQDVFVFYAIGDRNHFAGYRNHFAGYRLSCVIEQTTYRWEKVGNYTIPVFSLVYLVGGWSGKTTVLALVDDCIWKYFVKKSIWTKTKLCIPYDIWLNYDNTFHLDVHFVNDTKEILCIHISRRLVYRLSVSNGDAFVDQIHGDDLEQLWLLSLYPTEAIKYVVRVAGQGVKYYVFTEVCGTSTWSLQRRNVTGEQSWHLDRMNHTLLFPSKNQFQSLWRDTYYRIVIPFQDVMSVTPAMWSMNLGTKRWQVEGYLNFTDINIAKETMTHVISMHMQENVWLLVSFRYTMLIASRDHIRLMSSPRPFRTGFTIVTINSTSALLFGGRTVFDILNDLWQFSLTSRIWKKVKMIESSGSNYIGPITNETAESVPSPRYNHAAAVIGVEMFVFGGYNESGHSNLELWRYNMINNSWRYLKPTNQISHFTSIKGSECYFVATAQSETLWIVSRCPSFNKILKYNVNVYIRLWMFIVHLQTWNFVTFEKLENLPNNYIYSSLHFWRGYLISLESSSLLYIKAGCPEGLGSSNISRFPCDVCKVGFYSDVETKECRKCPNETTTRQERSSRLTECNVCVTGYCRHGRCLVVSDRLTQAPVCTCTIGFTGSHCQDATYYYIGTGVILVIGIITLLVVVLRRIIKKRRERETAFRRQIQILNDAWQISWQEIELQNEIGGGASGRVWKAQYRNLDVAVKMLINNDESESSLEFAGEIKFMQTMRHRNIVLFIGAGKTSPQAQPFLVVEFAHRGSLRHVLDDVSIEIDQNRKIDFALDASKGMEFLHKLNPPRIHRDLKSENLLVCKSWIVKVADFGLGRLFSGAQKNRRSNRNNALSSTNSGNELLVEMRDLSEDGIGTVRWSAPELARRESYDGSIDVYSFGIVLWEIWSRGFPFEQHRFAHEVDDAVERGERPIVPCDCPEGYASVMQACWAEGARKRPSFSEVVSCLESIHVEDVC